MCGGVFNTQGNLVAINSVRLEGEFLPTVHTQQAGEKTIRFRYGSALVSIAYIYQKIVSTLGQSIADEIFSCQSDSP